MMNTSLAAELSKEGFTCLLLHPGWVQTRLGGPGAQISTHESVEGLLEVIAGLGREPNGRFLDYHGNDIPW